jgi:hypothetical protein
LKKQFRRFTRASIFLSSIATQGSERSLKQRKTKLRLFFRHWQVTAIFTYYHVGHLIPCQLQKGRGCLLEKFNGNQMLGFYRRRDIAIRHYKGTRTSAWPCAASIWYIEFTVTTGMCFYVNASSVLRLHSVAGWLGSFPPPTK